LEGLVLARLEIDPDQYIECTDYFNHDRWLYFQSQLNTVGRVIKRLAKEYGFSEIRDSRWPTRGLKERKWGVSYRLTVLLNGQYIDQSKPNFNKEFYHVHLTRISYGCYLFQKSSSGKFLRTFTDEEIHNYDLIYQELKSLLPLLDKAESKGSGP
jgi:hypothetical protein